MQFLQPTAGADAQLQQVFVAINSEIDSLASVPGGPSNAHADPPQAVRADYSYPSTALKASLEIVSNFLTELEVHSPAAVPVPAAPQPGAAEDRPIVSSAT